MQFGGGNELRGKKRRKNQRVPPIGRGELFDFVSKKERGGYELEQREKAKNG